MTDKKFLRCDSHHDHFRPTGEKAKHIIVAAQPKSGSTFVCNVLAEILDVSVEKYSRKSTDDYVFDDIQANYIRKIDAVLHIHSKPTDIFLEWLVQNECPTIVLTRNLDGFSVSMRNHIMRGQKTVVREFIKDMSEKDQTEFVKRYWYGWCFDFCVKWARIVNDKVVPNSMIMDHKDLFSDKNASIKKIMRFLNLDVDDDAILAAVENVSRDPVRSNFTGSK